MKYGVLKQLCNIFLAKQEVQHRLLAAAYITCGRKNANGFVVGRVQMAHSISTISLFR